MRRYEAVMVALFGATLFTSAFLLFGLQPMVGKALLPLFGGTAAVWNLCLVFFQAALLAGYGYSHVLSAGSRLNDRPLLLQALVHFALVAVALLLLPPQVPLALLEQTATRTANGAPLTLVLESIFLWVGLPFIALSATSSLVQHWMGTSSHAKARDPYFLYAASNAGSLAALAAYPTVVESSLTVSEQYSLFRNGYALLAVLLLACVLWRARKPAANATEEPAKIAAPWTTRLRWLAFAFVPSSLMMGVTTYASTDLAAVPLLWIVPLLLYLLSFVLVFAARWQQGRWGARADRALALLAIPCLIGLFLDAGHHVALFLPLSLAFFFCASLVAHGRLAAERPEAAQLTQFYFFLSLGGVLGGAFNALLAPVLFDGIVEYPLMVLAACALRSGARESGSWLARLRAPAVAGGTALGLVLLSLGSAKVGWTVPLVVVLAVPALLAFRSVAIPRRYALALAAVFVVTRFSLVAAADPELLRSRSYYGTLGVKDTRATGMRVFRHGSTVHGLQSLDPAARREPLAYFSKEGPVGQIFELFRDRQELGARRLASPVRVGVVGLGIGTMAAYGRSTEEWHFFELDPNVVRVARDSGFFTFLDDSAAKPGFTFYTGDGRLRLREVPDGGYDMLFLDAFSSDSIPAHLLTREALRLYLSKLKPQGVIAFNATNRYFDFTGLLGALAADAGGVAYVRSHAPESLSAGKADSRWVVMARGEERLAPLAADGRWRRLTGDGRTPWTDDHHDLLRLLSVQR